MFPNSELDRRPGSAEWARALLAELADDDWTRMPACAELVNWLYMATRHRARRMDVPAAVQGDLVQDAMASMFQTLSHQRLGLVQHINPAAALERLAAEAMKTAHHDHLMRGYSGVKKNGRNWAKPYPHPVDGLDLSEWLPAPALLVQVNDRTTEATRRVAEWATQHLRLRLSSVALDATTYVLDRLSSGTSRSSLVRGGHSWLGQDPAMHFLGFDQKAATALGAWLLGRSDRHLPGVLDAALVGVGIDERVRVRWHATAIGCGFAEPQGPPPSTRSAVHPPAPDVRRLIA